MSTPAGFISFTLLAFASISTAAYFVFLHEFLSHYDVSIHHPLFVYLPHRYVRSVY